MGQILSASAIDSLLLDATVPLPVASRYIHSKAQYIQTKSYSQNMDTETIPGICAGYNHGFDSVVLRPVLLPIF